MPYLDDSELTAMIDKLKEEFGTANKEAVTENSYAFDGKHKEMREDLLFLEGMAKEKQGRLYVKSKLGFDK